MKTFKVQTLNTERQITSKVEEKFFKNNDTFTQLQIPSHILYNDSEDTTLLKQLSDIFLTNESFFIR